MKPIESELSLAPAVSCDPSHKKRSGSSALFPILNLCLICADLKEYMRATNPCFRSQKRRDDRLTSFSLPRLSGEVDAGTVRRPTCHQFCVRCVPYMIPPVEAT